MTAKQTRDWMSENEFNGNNFMSKWLVPMCGCNSGTTFTNRSVGNSPVFMPLDNSLNNDVKIQHDFHCALTSHLAIDDEMKFSNTAPKLILRGIRQLIEGHLLEDGVPSSKRIVEDCNRALDSMRTVCEHNGAIVPGLANRNGHIYCKSGTKSHGGATIKIEEIGRCRWIHPLIIDIKHERRKQIVDRFVTSAKSNDEYESDSEVEFNPTENDHVD